MSRPYITLWAQPQVEVVRRHEHGDQSLQHAANDQFRERGVAPGDRVYIVGTDDGRLLLLGRMTVSRVVDQREAERLRGPDVYKASDHLIGTGTPLLGDRVVPESIARSLRRESGKPIKIAADSYRVESLSLLTTGRITEESAALLDSLLDERVSVDPDAPGAVLEGGRREQRHQAIERSPLLRARAVACQGTGCRACGISFGDVYGKLGEGFIELHHLTPLSTLEGKVLVDPLNDVAVLCANCHRMVHRETPPLSIDALVRTIER